MQCETMQLAKGFAHTVLLYRSAEFPGVVYNSRGAKEAEEQAQYRPRLAQWRKRARTGSTYLGRKDWLGHPRSKEVLIVFLDQRQLWQGGHIPKGTECVCIWGGAQGKVPALIPFVVAYGKIRRPFWVLGWSSSLKGIFLSPVWNGGSYELELPSGGSTEVSQVWCVVIFNQVGHILG